MKFYHILLTMALLNIVMLYGLGHIKHIESQEFKEFGQFEPEMMLLEHDEMMLLCEKHNLIYDYESGTCL